MSGDRVIIDTTGFEKYLYNDRSREEIIRDDIEPFEEYLRWHVKLGTEDFFNIPRKLDEIMVRYLGERSMGQIFVPNEYAMAGLRYDDDGLGTRELIMLFGYVIVENSKYINDMQCHTYVISKPHL